MSEVRLSRPGPTHAVRYDPILCDLDGTLIDSSAGIEAALRAACEEVGHGLDPGIDLSWCVGPPLEANLERLLPAGVVARAATVYRAAYARLAPALTAAMPGAVAALDAIRAEGRRTGVVTHKHELLAQLMLERTGLVSYFDVVLGQRPDDQGPRSKAQLIEEALALIPKVDGDSQPILIGDHDEDARGAREAGIHFLRFAPGTGWDRIRSCVLP